MATLGMFLPQGFGPFWSRRSLLFSGAVMTMSDMHTTASDANPPPGGDTRIWAQRMVVHSFCSFGWRIWLVLASCFMCSSAAPEMHVNPRVVAHEDVLIHAESAACSFPETVGTFPWGLNTSMCASVGESILSVSCAPAAVTGTQTFVSLYGKAYGALSNYLRWIWGLILGLVGGWRLTFAR